MYAIFITFSFTRVMNFGGNVNTLGVALARRHILPPFLGRPRPAIGRANLTTHT